MKIRRIAAGTFWSVVVCLLILTACGDSQPKDEVTYRLKWRYNISVAGEIPMGIGP